MKLTGIVIVLALSACGGNSDDISGFVGTWMYAPGATSTITCNGGAPQTESITGTNVFAAGINADLSSTSANGTCVTLYDVTGEVATARSGQSCSSTSAGTTEVVMIQADTLTLSGGTMIAESASGNVTLSGASTGTCTVAGSLTMTKVSN